VIVYTCFYECKQCHDDATMSPRCLRTCRNARTGTATPIDLGDAWVLRKGDKVARCSLVTHQLGFELRLITTDLLRSQVCRSDEQVLDTHERWKSAMLQRGCQQRGP
jgi:hypothetical protein